MAGEGSNHFPSLQAYVEEFKFQSILAEDFLEFYLEYFPQLKEKRVDAIPGKQGNGPAGFREVAENKQGEMGKYHVMGSWWSNVWRASPGPQAVFHGMTPGGWGGVPQ